MRRVVNISVLSVQAQLLALQIERRRQCLALLAGKKELASLFICQVHLICAQQDGLLVIALYQY